MSIVQIRTITIPVEDQGRAKTFYLDALGFAERADQSMGELRWLEVGPAGGGTGIVLHRIESGTDPGSSRGLMLFSRTVDEDVARLHEAGIEVDGPHDMPWARQATFSDPPGRSPPGVELPLTAYRDEGDDPCSVVSRAGDMGTVPPMIA